MINYISKWKSKRLTHESIKTPSTANNFPNPRLSYYVDKIGVIFNENCLQQDKVTYGKK